MLHSRRLLLAAVCLAIASGGLSAQAAKGKDAPPKLATQGATPDVGDITLDYTFQNLITGDGRTSMKEFRGSVVLVDWWGIH